LIKPEGAPLPNNLPPFNLKVIWNVIVTVLPTFGLILAVLGSIFAGVASPTEASGIGALGASLLAWKNKRFNMKVLKQVIKATFESVGFVFGIFVGATFFALVLRLLGGDEFIESMITSIPLGPYGILALIMGMVFILGFFLDWIEISLIVLPLLGPIVSSLGFEINGYGKVETPELVWFVVIIAVCLQTSFLTPPVGFSLFFLAGVAPKGTELIEIYKGVIPFIIIQLIGLALVIMWPQLVIWLPAMAY
jgi:tripartite ATP-independent transporter DctM subunit